MVINVKDNGIGISATTKQKIMQPFFTTKPTGEGTGLGLSLSYDMVVCPSSGSSGSRPKIIQRLAIRFDWHYQKQ